MKAAWRERYGAPAELAIKELPIPVPGENEILVRVMATTVNRTDCAVLTGKPFIMRFFTGFFKPKSAVPGTDFAGVVEATGPGVRAYQAGDKIWGFDDQGLGSQAEYFVLPEAKPIAKIPDGISFAAAAAGAEAAHYAFNFLNKVRLSPGSKVLVNGASGAIGSALVQFLKFYEADVTAVCGTPNIRKIKDLGADKVIDYLKEDFTTGPGGYDFILDAVGKSTFWRCRRLLGPRGVYLSSEPGPGGQNIFLPLLTIFSFGRKVIFPVPANIPRSLAFVADLMAQGKFKPLIEREYPLAQIADAYRLAHSGEKVGNLVITYR